MQRIVCVRCVIRMMVDEGEIRTVTDDSQTAAPVEEAATAQEEGEGECCIIFACPQQCAHDMNRKRANSTRRRSGLHRVSLASCRPSGSAALAVLSAATGMQPLFQPHSLGLHRVPVAISGPLQARGTWFLPGLSLAYHFLACMRRANG